MSVKDFAKAALKRDWKIFPLNGKKPITKNGCKNATGDLDQVNDWFNNWPKMNYGIATGPESQLYVLDIDPPDGEESLAKLPPLPETFTVKTGRGGTHYYFTTDQPLKNTTNRLGKNIDTRGDGGYVVGPGSTHPETKEQYEVISNAAVAPVPDWLIERLTKEQEFPRPQRKMEHDINHDAYVKSATDGIYKEIASAPQGQRNSTLNKAAFRLGKFVNTGLITDDYALNLLENAGRDAGLTDKEIAKTSRSGLTKGKESGEVINLKSPPPPEYSPPPKEALPTKESNQLNRYMELIDLGDLGDAQIFAEETKAELAFNHSTNKWMQYINGKWTSDETDKTLSLTHAVLYPIYQKYCDFLHQKKMEAVRIDDQDSIAKYKSKHKKISYKRDALGSYGKITKIRNIAKTKSGVTNEVFNTQPLLFNLKNGTYNFETRKLQPHNHQEFLSRQADIQFNPHAECPRFLLFLNEIFEGKEDLIEYVLKVCGLSLTGRTDVQKIFFCYGKGANGKSTFFNVLQLILSDFYIDIPAEVLLTNRMKSSTDEYHLSMLDGARMAVTTEIAANRKFKEETIKNVTGGQPFPCRLPYGQPFTVTPTHTLWMFGNHKPHISVGDQAIERRISLIPFNAYIPPEKRRPMSEMMADFEAEKSGILNLFIDYYHKFEQEGLEDPAVVSKAIKEYFKEQDTFLMFKDNSVTESNSLKVTLKDLYDRYKTWCLEENEYLTYSNSRKLKAKLQNMGYKVEKGTGNKTYVFDIGWKSY